MNYSNLPDILMSPDNEIKLSDTHILYKIRTRDSVELIVRNTKRMYDVPDANSYSYMKIDKKSGRILMVMKHKNGLLHSCKDQPASEISNPDNNNKMLSWYKNGYHSRKNNKPSKLYVDINKKILISIHTDEYGNPHRLIEPAMTSFYEKTRNLKSVKFFNHGELHSYENKPSIITYFDMPGRIINVLIWTTNKLPIDMGDNPNYIEYFPCSDKKVRRHCWFGESRKLHRENKPACVLYGLDGLRIKEACFINGLMGSHNSPALIEYYPGTIHKMREVWMLNGEIHRDFDDLPAIIEYFPSNSKLGIPPNTPSRKLWVMNNKLSRHNNKHVEEVYNPKTLQVEWSYYYDDPYFLTKYEISAELFR